MRTGTKKLIYITIDIQNDSHPHYPRPNRMAVYGADAVKLQETGTELENHRNFKQSHVIWILTDPKKSQQNWIGSLARAWENKGREDGAELKRIWTFHLLPTSL